MVIRVNSWEQVKHDDVSSILVLGIRSAMKEIELNSPRNPYLVTAEQMRAFDFAAINEFAIPGVVLMENAGRASFEILKGVLDDDLDGLCVSIVAGPGNNGGDGYVIARYLINKGADVETFLLSPREKIRGDARINLNILEKMGARIWEINSIDALESVQEMWAESSVIVDAILGTGLQFEVRSPYREAIEKINSLDAIKLSVDIPSGLDSDTGKILGVAVRADVTVTYGFKKLGMAIHPGLGLCGQTQIIDIGIPENAVQKNTPNVILYEKPDLRQYLDLRSDPTAHKGIFGRVLIVGGSSGKTGSVAMAAMAASRMGAGLVTVAVPASLNPILESKLTEEMTEPVYDESGYFLPSAADRVLELAQDKDVVAVGPGLSTEPGALKIVQSLLSRYDGKLIIDADGLNCLAQDLSFLSRTKADVVLTPHPGEMARLLGVSCSQVQENRFVIGREFATTHKCKLVLKGAGTITFFPSGQAFVNNTGNSWMASGGHGDVLTGILAGLIAQKLPLEAIIPFGVWFHGFVADGIVERDGPGPVVATDIVSEVPNFLQIVIETYAGKGEASYPRFWRRLNGVRD